MEPLVLASMLVVGIALISVLTTSRKTANVLVLAAAALLITQWLVDGYRWQMLACYLALLLALGTLVVNNLRQLRHAPNWHSSLVSHAT